MIEYNFKSLSIKDKILNIISTLLVNMIVIIMATKIFKNISVYNVFFTFLTALLLMIMNKCIKPFLKLIMLPLNIYTLGLTYPFINVIILKLISFFLNPYFELNGWFSAFFISIFISIMTILVDVVIGRSIRNGGVL